MRYPPEHAARAVEIMERLSPLGAPRAEYEILMEILRNPNRWKEAHQQFQLIRINLTLPAERNEDRGLEYHFGRVAENAAKTAYNCSGEPAPFDQASFKRLLGSERDFLALLPAGN